MLNFNKAAIGCYLMLCVPLLLGCDSKSKRIAGYTLSKAGRDSAAIQGKKNTLAIGQIIDSLYSADPAEVLAAVIHGFDRFSGDSAIADSFEGVIPDSLERKRPVLLLTDVDLPLSAEKIFDLDKSVFWQISSPACLVSNRQIAVIEYATKYTATKVIIVMANSNSRMISAACDHVKTDNFEIIAKELNTAMAASREFADRSSANKDFVNNVAQNQANISLQLILNQSPQINALVNSGKVILKCAYYDAVSKRLSFLEPTNALNTLVNK